MGQRYVHEPVAPQTRAPEIVVVPQPRQAADQDGIKVSIGDLTVIADPPSPQHRRRWRGPLGIALAVLVLVAGVVVGRELLSDDAGPVAVVGSVVPPDSLSVQVTAAATTVVYGESLELHFTWHDGDGTLIDVNQVESTAVQYRRDVPCDKSVARPHAVSDQGSWTYTPDAMNFGPPPTEPRIVQVGLEVRTGGCAPTERVVEQVAITVLPPA